MALNTINVFIIDTFNIKLQLYFLAWLEKWCILLCAISTAATCNGMIFIERKNEQKCHSQGTIEGETNIRGMPLKERYRKISRNMIMPTFIYYSDKFLMPHPFMRNHKFLHNMEEGAVCLPGIIISGKTTKSGFKKKRKRKIIKVIRCNPFWIRDNKTCHKKDYTTLLLSRIIAHFFSSIFHSILFFFILATVSHCLGILPR